MATLLYIDTGAIADGARSENFPKSLDGREPCAYLRQKELGNIPYRRTSNWRPEGIRQFATYAQANRNGDLPTKCLPWGARRSNAGRFNSEPVVQFHWRKNS